MRKGDDKSCAVARIADVVARFTDISVGEVAVTIFLQHLEGTHRWALKLALDNMENGAAANIMHV